MHLIGYAIHVSGQLGEYPMRAIYDEGYLDRDSATARAEQLTRAAQATPLGQWQAITYSVVSYIIPALPAQLVPHLSELWQLQHYGAWGIPRSYAGEVLRYLAQLDCEILGVLEGAVYVGWNVGPHRETWKIHDDSGTLILELINHTHIRSCIPLFAQRRLLDPLTIAARIVCVLRRHSINWTWTAESTEQWLLDLLAIDVALSTEPNVELPLAS